MTQRPPGPPFDPGHLPPGQGYQPTGPGGQPSGQGYPPQGPAYPPPAGHDYPPPPPPGAYIAEPPYPPPPPPGGGQRVPSRPPQRSSPLVAPVLAFLAMVLVAAASYGIVSYLGATIDTSATEAGDEFGDEVTAAASLAPASPETAPESGQPDGTDGSPASETEEPESVVTEEPEGTAEPITVVPPSDERADVAGSILFTRLGGDVWAASGTTMSPLTNSSSTKADRTPTWSPDGKHIYFIRSTKYEVKDGKARYEGKYTLYPTDLMRMKADGSDKQKVYSSLISDARGKWFSHVLQPSVNPADGDIAVVSDGKDGEAEEVTLHIIDGSSGRMLDVATATEPAFGHNDPDYSPDGSQIAFTYNESDGTEGDPKIAILTCATKKDCTSGKTRYLKSGFANPSWSPNGTLLAVEATRDKGRDIAIVTAKGGHERVRLTTDGNSFAPEFSPNGDQIAYLKRDGLGIDVRVMTLDIDDTGKITLVDDRPVTSDGEADGESGLSWFMPSSERSRSVDIGEGTAAEASEQPLDEALDGAPPPPPGS